MIEKIAGFSEWHGPGTPAAGARTGARKRLQGRRTEEWERHGPSLIEKVVQISLELLILAREKGL